MKREHLYSKSKHECARECIAYKCINRPTAGKRLTRKCTTRPTSGNRMTRPTAGKCMTLSTMWGHFGPDKQRTPEVFTGLWERSILDCLPHTTHNTQPDYLPQAHTDTEIDKGGDIGRGGEKKGCKSKSSSAKT
jgi:hypothetical protein